MSGNGAYIDCGTISAISAPTEITIIARVKWTSFGGGNGNGILSYRNGGT
jgi:hypothetical protein